MDSKEKPLVEKEPALILYQKRAIKEANILLATAETEKQNLLHLGWNNKIYVIPNGIITDGIECKNLGNKQNIYFPSITTSK